MPGRNQPDRGKCGIRSHIAKFLMGGALSCLLAVPAGATGYASPVNWSGPWASIGIGGVIMDVDNEVSATRSGGTTIEIACPERFNDRVVTSCLIGPLTPGQSVGDIANQMSQTLR